MRINCSFILMCSIAMLMLSGCGLGWNFGKRKYTPGYFADMPAGIPSPDRNEIVQKDTRKKVAMLPQHRSTLRPAFDMNITGPVLKLSQIKQICAPRKLRWVSPVYAAKPIPFIAELQGRPAYDIVQEEKKGYISVGTAGALGLLTVAGSWLSKTTVASIGLFNFLTGLIAPFYAVSIILAIIAIGRKDKYYGLAIAVLLFDMILLLLYDGIFLVLVLG